MPIEDFTKTILVHRAMVIEPDDLRRFDAALRDFCDSVTYQIDCGPATTMRLDIKSLLAHDNPPSRPITKIRIRSAYGSKVSCTVSLRGGMFGGFEGEFTGKPASVETICQKFEDFADQVKPWYSRICAIDPMTLAFALCIGTFVGLQVLSAFYPRKGPPEAVDPQAQSRAMLFMFGFFGLAWIVSWLKSRIFPDFVVAIGHGAKRHQNLEWVRWGVVIALVVGTTGSLIATAIVALLPA